MQLTVRSHINYGQIPYALELEIVDRVPHLTGHFLPGMVAGSARSPLFTIAETALPRPRGKPDFGWMQAWVDIPFHCPPPPSATELVQRELNRGTGSNHLGGSSCCGLG